MGCHTARSGGHRGATLSVDVVRGDHAGDRFRERRGGLMGTSVLMKSTNVVCALRPFATLQYFILLRWLSESGGGFAPTQPRGVCARSMRSRPFSQMSSMPAPLTNRTPLPAGHPSRAAGPPRRPRPRTSTPQSRTAFAATVIRDKAPAASECNRPAVGTKVRSSHRSDTATCQPFSNARFATSSC